jgi:type III secretion protein R
MTAGIGSSIVGLVVLTGLLSLMPLLVVTVTSFAKIAIVLFLVRNALGIQQTPPNLVLYAAAIVLSAYVMAPVLQGVWTVVADPRLALTSVADWERAATEAARPVRGFLDKHATPESRSFFIESSHRLWTPEQVRAMAGERDLAILVPSFLVSELKRAFEIGFLLYLPFVMVDLVVSAVLMALGMQMMSPTVVSTPLKLLLFVAVDGWSRLLQGLILTYAPVA